MPCRYYLHRINLYDEQMCYITFSNKGLSVFRKHDV